MGEDLLEMEGLVRHEGAQRIDEDAGFALEQGGARSMQMEYEDVYKRQVRSRPVSA